MKPIDLQHSNAADPVAAEVTRLVCDAVPSTSLLTSAATSIRVNGRPWRQTALLTLGAVALFIGIRRFASSSFLSALISPSGPSASCAPRASAAYSRDRLIAI